MMTRLCQLMLLLSLLTGCYRVSPEPVYDPLEGPATEDAIPELEYIVISYSNVLEDEERIFLLDSRGWYDEEGVFHVCMRFRTQLLLCVLEARDLMVRVVEGFLSRVNNDPILPLYLKDCPMVADQLSVNIEFESFFGKYVDPTYMARTRLECGIVYYYSFTATDPDQQIWLQRVEPYEKAYRFSLFKHMDENLRQPMETQLNLPFREFSPMPHVESTQPSTVGYSPLPNSVIPYDGTIPPGAASNLPPASPTNIPHQVKITPRGPASPVKITPVNFNTPSHSGGTNTSSTGH